MKFSLLMDILNKADMVTEVAIQEDCEVADLNLMDRECQQMYNQTVYFIRAEEIGPTTKLPACLIYQGGSARVSGKELAQLGQNSRRRFFGRSVPVCEAAAE